MSINLEKSIVVLFALLIPLNYLGRGLYNIDLGLILCFFLIFVIRNKIQITSLKKLYFIVTISAFYLIVLLINYLNPTYDYYKNIKLLIVLAAVLYIANYIFIISTSKRENFLLFQKLFFYFVAFISFLVILSFILEINIFYTIKYLKVIEFHHSDFHSRQNMFAVCIAFYLSYYLQAKSKINLFFLLLIYFGVFASQGRTAILVISLGTTAYLLYSMYLKKEFNKEKFYVIIGICFISLLVMLYISNNGFNTLHINTSGRFDGWLVYLKLVLDKNTLLGYGIQGGQYVYDAKLLPFKHPHNIFVEAFFSLGIVGLFFFISIVLLYIFLVWKSNYKVYDKPLIIAFCISVLLMEQGIGSLWGTNHIVPLILMAYLSLNAPSHFRINHN